MGIQFKINVTSGHKCICVVDPHIHANHVRVEMLRSCGQQGAVVAAAAPTNRNLEQHRRSVYYLRNKQLFISCKKQVRGNISL